MKKRLKYLLIFSFVIVSLGVAYGIARPSTKAVENNIKPAAHTIPKTNIQTNTPQEPTVDTDLQNKITSWTEGQSGNFGISIQEINGKQRQASYQANKKFVTASTYKLFVTYAILKDIEQGNHTLQSQTSLGLNVSQCIDAMLIRSNNDCGYPVGKLVGWSTLNEMLAKQGFANTNIYNYDASGNTTVADKVSTAQDEANFMYKLVNGELLQQPHIDLMLSRMKKQIYRERIPAGVPGGIEVADKPGWLPGIQSDTGIVYGTKSTYVVSIMSSGTTAAQLASVSKLIYEYLNQ